MAEPGGGGAMLRTAELDCDHDGQQHARFVPIDLRPSQERSAAVKPGTKRKLQTHKPVIGGVVEEFACVYAVLAVNGHDCTPVKIGACSNLVGHLEDLQ